MDGANNPGIEPAGKWRRVGSTSEPDTHLADPFAPAGDPWEPGGRDSISWLRSSSVPCRRATFQCPINPGDVSRERRGGQE